MESVNLMAVFLAAAANFIMGSLWHGPLFGKQWMRMMGITPETMKDMKLTPLKAMGLGFINILVMAFVLAQLATMLGTSGAMGAFWLTLWIWLGFVVTTMAGSVIWENRPVRLFLFNIAYQFVSLFATALVLVWWL